MLYKNCRPNYIINFIVNYEWFIFICIMTVILAKLLDITETKILKKITIFKKLCMHSLVSASFGFFNYYWRTSIINILILNFQKVVLSNWFTKLQTTFFNVISALKIVDLKKEGMPSALQYN